MGNVYDKEICGRNIDKIIVEFAKGEIQKSDEFKKIYESKLKADKKTYLRILQSVISVKEKLSVEGASTVYLFIVSLNR